MNYEQFRKAMVNMDKRDPRREEIIRNNPHYVEHMRNLTIAKLAEIRARKQDQKTTVVSSP